MESCYEDFHRQRTTESINPKCVRRWCMRGACVRSHNARVASLNNCRLSLSANMRREHVCRWPHVVALLTLAKFQLIRRPLSSCVEAAASGSSEIVPRGVCLLDLPSSFVRDELVETKQPKTHRVAAAASAAVRGTHSKLGLLFLAQFSAPWLAAWVRPFPRWATSPRHHPTISRQSHNRVFP